MRLLPGHVKDGKADGALHDAICRHQVALGLK